VTPERLAEIAIEVAREAGALALGGFRTRMDVREKGHADLVTEFDVAVERLVRERLAEKTPDIAIVGEEEGGNVSGELVWHVDPVDGTTNYAHGHPVWAVSIGLTQANVPLVGAVTAPALGLEWVGVVGSGALRNREACRVSATDSIERALCATGFPRDRSRSPDNNFSSFTAVKKIVSGVRRCGAAALDLCWVADGTYDAYWERKLSTWDLVAGAAIVLAAGGRVSHLDGGPLQLETGHVLADNGHLHAVMLELLRDA
jgi:myo-inositol-1(or 4)-monophosphatase